MATLSVQADLKPLTRSLDDLQKKQLPFATALALTDVAKTAQAHVKAELPSIFDKPTPFTMNSIGIKAARKSNLEAVVFVKEKQAEYLKIQETGGQGQPKKQAFVIPKGIGTNQYGNMPKGAFGRAKAKPGSFVGNVHGVGGLFFRGKPRKGSTDKPKLRLLAMFTKQAEYKPRFGFKQRVTTVVQKALPGAFEAAMGKAMASAPPTGRVGLSLGQHRRPAHE